MPRVPAVDDGELYGLGYARISGSKEQKDSALSIPAQNGHIAEAMERERAIYVESTDDILQGTRSDRPGYQRLLAIVRRLRGEGKRVAVFIVRLDRFGRDGEERQRAWKELAALGVRLYSCRQGGWVTDRFLYDIDAAVSQREVEMIGARVRDVNEFVRARGFPVIGRPAWGYRIRDATPEERALGSGKKMLDEHPVEAPAVRRVWELRAGGASLGDVHRYVLGLSKDQTGGRAFARPTLRRLFSAAVYVGRHDYPEGHVGAATPVLERDPCRWPRLVSDDMYRAAACAVDEHARLPKQGSGTYLLTGLLRCARCGARMVGTPYTARVRQADGTIRVRTSRRYRCNGYLMGAGATTEQRACSTVIVCETVDTSVVEQVSRALAGLDDPARHRQLEQIWESLRARRRGTVADDLAGRIAAAEKTRATWVDARATAYPDHKAGLITRQEYDEIRERAQGEIAAAEKDLEDLRRRLAEEGEGTERALPRLAVVLARLGSWQEALTDGDTAKARALLAELVSKVEPVRIVRGRYRARIAWTERGRALRKVARALAGDPGWVLERLAGPTLQQAPGLVTPHGAPHAPASATTPRAPRPPHAAAAPTPRHAARASAGVARPLAGVPSLHP